MAKTQNDRRNKKEQVIIFKQFTVKQFISLIIGILFGLTGLGLIITELVGSNISGIMAYDDAYQQYLAAKNSFNAGTHTTIGFLGWGIIALIFGSVVIAFALSLSSKTEDRAKESEARKAARRRDLLGKHGSHEVVEAVVEEPKAPVEPEAEEAK